MGSHRAPDAARAVACRVAIIAILVVAFVLATAWFDGGNGITLMSLWIPPEWPRWKAPLRMFANALPGLLLACSLLAWTRRAGWSFALAFGVEALLYGVNDVKVANLAIPLMPADFDLLGELGQGAGELLSGYIPHLALLIAGGLLAIVVLAFWFRFEPPSWPRRSRPWGVAAGVLPAAALATLIAGVPFWNGMYGRHLLDVRLWSPMMTRQHNGLISSLILFHLQGRRAREASVPDALALMARYAPPIEAASGGSAGTPSAAKPDIVVILSESFFDPTIMKGYPPGTDLTPNLHRLEQHGISGWLHVPTFGGGTIRTEFEVLTGLSLRYFPKVQAPYLQINRKQIPGIVRTLDRDGYETLAVHGNSPGFWNRTQAYRELGFEKFISIRDFPADDKARDGEYMSDKAFTDELLRQLPDSGPPRFVLGISIEAHGGYDGDHGIDTQVRDTIPVPKGVTDPQAKRELQNYIYHMRHADQQLGRLVDTLARRKRRTLIVFFGDHLPSLVPAYREAGFRNGQGFLVQTPPYLLIDTAHMDHATKQNAAAWELPGMLLARAGIHDPWFVLTQMVGPELAPLTRTRNAPVAAETAEQKRLDKGMHNADDLRLHGKLEALWPKAEAMAAAPSSSSNRAATMGTAQADH